MTDSPLGRSDTTTRLWWQPSARPEVVTGFMAGVKCLLYLPNVSDFHPSYYSVSTDALSPGVKQPVREADYLPSAAEV